MTPHAFKDARDVVKHLQDEHGFTASSSANRDDHVLAVHRELHWLEDRDVTMAERQMLQGRG